VEDDNNQPAESPADNQVGEQSSGTTNDSQSAEESQTENEAPQSSQDASAGEAPPEEPVPAESTPAQSVPVVQPQNSFIKDLLLKAKEKIQFNKRKKLEKILELAKKKGKISNSDACLALRISQATASRYFEELVKESRLKQVGEGRAASYEIAN